MRLKARAGHRINNIARVFAAAMLAYAAPAALPQAAHAQSVPAANGFIINNTTTDNIECTYNHGGDTENFTVPINPGDSLNMTDSDVSTLRFSCKSVNHGTVFDEFEDGHSYAIVDHGYGPELEKTQE